MPVAADLLTEAEYVPTYRRQTGREHIGNLDFYLAFNIFRFAAIVRGINGRMIRENAASTNAREMVSHLPRLAALAHEISENTASA